MQTKKKTTRIRVISLSMAILLGTGSSLTALAGPSLASNSAGNDLGLDNDLTGACIGVTGAAYALNKLAAELLVPWFDVIPVLGAWGANLANKFCAPVIEPPDPVAFTPSPGQCHVDVFQPVTKTTWSMGPGLAGNLFEAALDGTFLGQFGWPIVAHFNADVEIALHHGGTPLGNGFIRLPVGRNVLTWRADTLISPEDYVPVYIPGSKGARVKTGKRRKPARNENLEFLTEFALAHFDSFSHGIFNNELQRAYVLDTGVPTISTSRPELPIEATEPGGVSKAVGMRQARPTITFADDCDQYPDLNYPGPAFWPIGQEIVLEWTVSDSGPVNTDGSGRNTASVRQTILVEDTRPPDLLAPPSIVRESTTPSTAVRLGNPQVFDLADLDVAVEHNALEQPGVTGTYLQPRFPRGQTLVTWTATDASDNMSTATQLITIKGVGENTTPVADDQSVGQNGEVQSFTPHEITITAADGDFDPLSFAIVAKPQHGFFEAPLLPHFIDDYRVERHMSGQDLSDSCASTRNASPSGPFKDGASYELPFPSSASYVAVDDAGVTYVIDQGSAFCQQASGHVDYADRIAIFEADGTLRGATRFDPAPKSIYIDHRAGFITLTEHTSGGTGFVFLYDLDLTLLETFRTDVADVPEGENRLDKPTNAVVDSAGVMYVTDGKTLRAYRAAYVPRDQGGQANEPVSHRLGHQAYRIWYCRGYGVRLVRQSVSVGAERRE